MWTTGALDVDVPEPKAEHVDGELDDEQHRDNELGHLEGILRVENNG